MSFLRMKDPEQAVLEQFQVKKLPALFIMTVDEKKEGEADDEDEKKTNLKLAQFTGKFNYD